MGGCNSSAAAVDGLELAMVAAVLRAKARAPPSKKKSSFNGLIMQFPAMRPGFHLVHELFEQIAGGRKALTLDDLQKQKAALGLPESLDLIKLHEQAAVTTVKSDELVLIYTVLSLTNPDEVLSSVDPSIKKTLDVVEKAFMFFDSSSDGYLEKSELLTVLKSGTKVFGSKQGRRHNKSVGELLFDYLDFDHSGKVSFKEFLLGIQQLVMSQIDELDEIEDMEHFVQSTKPSMVEGALGTQAPALQAQH